MRPTALALLSLLALLLPAVAQAEPGTCPAIPQRTPMPADALPSAPPYAAWEPQIRAIAARLPEMQRETRKLVFIGDSITAGWDPGVFAKFYGRRAPLLLGVSGDVTQGILQRLPGEWGTLHPQLVILLAGTNNTQWMASTPEDLALGLAEIVRMVHRLSPVTKVLVLGILPRGTGPGDPLRMVNTRVNALAARCADGTLVFYADPGRALLDASGTLSREMSFDLLHLTPQGYAALATAMEPEVRRLLGE